jgi:serine/threonine protein phosphatase PrpC
VRALNEDVYVSRPEQGLFVVCDGMGGAPDGEVASAGVLLVENSCSNLG